MKIVQSSVFLEDCVVAKNSKKAFNVCGTSSRLYIAHCDVRGNLEGTFSEESTVLDPPEENVSSVDDSSSSSSFPSSSLAPLHHSSGVKNETSSYSADGVSGSASASATDTDIHKYLQPEHQINRNSDAYKENLGFSLYEKDIPSSSVQHCSTERRFLVKHCIGDEEAVSSFDSHRWYDAEEDPSEHLTLTLRPDKATKLFETDVAESFVSKMKRKREQSTHFADSNLGSIGEKRHIDNDNSSTACYEEMDENMDLDMDLSKSGPGSYERDRDRDSAYQKMVKLEKDHEHFSDVKIVKLEKF